MKRTTLRKTLIAAAVAGATVLGTAAYAHGGGYGPGYGMGPGMNYGPGYHMGRGMMRGYGPRFGACPGFGGGPGYGFNLSDEQRSRIDKIQGDTASKQWALMRQLQEERAHLNEQFYSDKRDEAAVSKTYSQIAELRKQMFDNALAARKEIDGVLTKEQREQFRR